MIGGSLVVVAAVLGLVFRSSVPLLRLAVSQGPSWPRRRTVVAFTVAVVVCTTALRSWPAVAVCVAVVTLGGVRLRRMARIRAERTRSSAGLPVSLELCMVTLGAGGTVADCLRTLAANGVEPGRSVAAAALDLIGDGALLDDALLRFQQDLGPSYQPLSGALRLASEQGGSIAPLLDRLAIEARAERRRAGELRARRLSVVLLLPLIGFSLPAVLIGVLVPLALVAFGQLR